jgi:SulP family sulfate permease
MMRPGYGTDLMRADLVAGLTAAAVVIPKAMAYATVAGLPVQVGIYTVFLPMLIYAALGSSRVLSVSTTTTLAILTGADLVGIVRADDPARLAGALATLTLLVGAVLVLASVLRLGFVASFISEPVLVGFKSGIGLVIIVDQVPKILGLHISRGTLGQNLLAIVRGLPEASVLTLSVGVITIAGLALIERHLPRIPAPLVAVAAGIGGMALLHMSDLGVQTVGEIPRGLPSFTPPDPTLAGPLWAGALGIALMSFTETIAAGSAFALDDERRPRANRELLSTGLANLGGALVGAMPAGGGTTQTAVNRLAGARTRAAGLVTSLMALGTMLLLAPVIGMMPEATLAAVVIVYSVELVRPGEFLAILKVRRMEFIWAITAFAGVVVLGTLRGIVVAIVMSLVALAWLATNPPIYVLGRKRGTNVYRPLTPEHPDDETFPGLLILRPEGRIFFANVGHLAEKMRSLVDRAKPRVVILDLSGVPDLEYTALKTLIATERRERKRGVMLWLAGLSPDTLSIVQRSSLGPTLGRERMHFNLEVAMAKYLAAAPAGQGPAPAPTGGVAGA